MHIAREPRTLHAAIHHCTPKVDVRAPCSSIVACSHAYHHDHPRSVTSHDLHTHLRSAPSLRPAAALRTLPRLAGRACTTTTLGQQRSAVLGRQHRIAIAPSRRTAYNLGARLWMVSGVCMQGVCMHSYSSLWQCARSRRVCMHSHEPEGSAAAMKSSQRRLLVVAHFTPEQLAHPLTPAREGLDFIPPRRPLDLIPPRRPLH